MFFKIIIIEDDLSQLDWSNSSKATKDILGFEYSIVWNKHNLIITKYETMYSQEDQS